MLEWKKPPEQIKIHKMQDLVFNCLSQYEHLTDGI